MGLNVTKRNASKIAELALELSDVKKAIPSSFPCNVKNPVSYGSSSAAGGGIRSSKKESSSIYGSYKKYFCNANTFANEVIKYLSDVIVVLENQSSGINKIDKETVKKTENNVLAKVKAGSAITKSLLKGSFATTNTGATNTSSGVSSKSVKLAKIVNEVILGRWGAGAIRKKKLEAAGYNYEEVQALVNAKLLGKKVTPKTITSTESNVSSKESSDTPKKKDTVKESKTENSGKKEKSKSVKETKTKDVDLGKYSSPHFKSSASSSARNSSVSAGHKTYVVGKDISESDRKLLIYQICGESGNSKSDMLGVGSTILNRLESGGGSVKKVLESGYWPWGKTYLSYAPGGRYANTDWGKKKIATATKVVDDMLSGGVRAFPKSVKYYTGNGVYNTFSDRI